MLAFLAGKSRALLRDRKANVAMMFGLSLVPMLVATGAGIDFARGVMVHQRMAAALDAAALAVGNATSKPSSCSSSGNAASQASCAPLQQTAQQYFDQNYDHTKDANYGTPGPVSISISDQSVTLNSSLPLKLTLLGVASLDIGTPTVNASSTVVWGQTKLWVALVLDNSGSMAEGDSGGSKMDALHDAITNSTYGLLTILQTAAANNGDVEVGIVPFNRSVKMGYSAFASSGYIDWGEWEASPQPIGTNLSYAVPNAYFSNPSTISFQAWGPGDNCPFTNSSNREMSPFGFSCDTNNSNGGSTTSTIPSSGTYKGYICPAIDSGDYNTDHRDRYYNGCWTSTKMSGTTIRVATGSSAACTGFSSTNCSCTGSFSSKHCDTQAWTHVWVPNNHNTWSGCVMDRQQKNKQTTLGSGTGFRTPSAQDYDEGITQANNSTSVWDDTQFPAENNTACTSATAAVTALNYNWTTLASQINAMQPAGNTNQAIGVEHGWQMLTTGAPYATGTLPAGTTKVLILFSDGLNTQDRWYGDGSTEGTTEDGYIDSRENAACTTAKAAGVVIYSIYINIGNDGNATALQNCASDSTKYYDLTASSQIKTAFSDIAQKITNLRVSK
jgi:Flp pilus assembly protein TadG